MKFRDPDGKIQATKEAILLWLFLFYLSSLHQNYKSYVFSSISYNSIN